MAISRVKPAGWGYAVKLSSSEANQLDTNLTRCFDKVNGDTITGETVVDGYNLTIFAPGKLQAEKIDLQDTELEGTTAISEVTLRGAIAISSNGDVSLTGETSIDAPWVTTPTIKSSGYLQYSSSAITGSSFAVDGYRTYAPTDASDYSKWSLLVTGGFKTSAAAGSTFVRILLNNLPDAAVIKEVNVYIEPNTGHSGLPAAMPAMALYRHHYNSGGASLIANVTDSSASVLAYETPHPLTLSSLSHTVDAQNYKYFLYVAPESSTNELTNFIVRSARIHFQISQQNRT